MSNHIQIEPATTHRIKTGSKRSSSFYTCISKLIKMRAEIRKHRTLPNDHFQEKCLLQEEDHDEDSFNEKIEIVDAHKSACLPPPSWSNRYTTQLALPPKLNLISNHHDLLPQDQDFYSSSSTCSLSSCIKFNQLDSDDEENDDDEEEEEHNYVYGSSYSYSMTLQKLSGISFEDQNKPKTNTAVLITLSPCALAAANAARQKRQKIRTYHH